MHWDGARALLSGTEGFDLQRYSALFDTVYVSLYKYLGAPFGAVLAGNKATIAKVRDLGRRCMAGTDLSRMAGGVASAGCVAGISGAVCCIAGGGRAAIRRITGCGRIRDQACARREQYYGYRGLASTGCEPAGETGQSRYSCSAGGGWEDVDLGERDDRSTEHAGAGEGFYGDGLDDFKRRPVG